MKITCKSFGHLLLTAPIIGTALLIGVAATPARTTPTPDTTPVPAPQFTDAKELILPPDYREWTYLSSGIGMTYGPAASSAIGNQMFENVFVRPEAYRAFQKAGKWPDHTLFILEIRASSSHGSIVKGGSFQTKLVRFEVALKDEKRYPEKWAYFDFGAPHEGAMKAAAQPKQSCFVCHMANGAVDNTFVQFYPTLLETATKLKLVDPDSTTLLARPKNSGHLASATVTSKASKR